MPRMPATRSLKLAAIGVAAGAFSGLFGVGGGVVLVPLLLWWLGYDARAAAGTSLAAIALIAAAGAAWQGLSYGNLRVGYGLLIGLPAIAGVLAGTALARRLPVTLLSYLFAGVLVASAVELVLQ
jgi:uncharacterized membrane protein YfcA